MGVLTPLARHAPRHEVRRRCQRECETKTKTFVKVTGYEDTDCKEVELKRPVHHGYLYHKREAEADPHGFAYEKVTKTFCKKTPVTEEVSKDFSCAGPSQARFARIRRSRFPSWCAGRSGKLTLRTSKLNCRR